ncbi:MAG TPA: hypothetical protein VFB21_15890 [Chthonomonadaceae bacterium]|nr:hypothetical protein [Chthonomonadaceae bacterium]
MNRMSKRSVLLALAGIGLSCCMGALPVSADDRETYADPMPLSYPYAAPGTLDMRHWKDYTRTAMEPGSAADKRMEMRKMQDAQTLSGKPIQDDAENLAPMPLSYPYAAPGMLDMWHWTDYTRTKLEPGSVSDVQFERDKRMREKTEQK